MPTTLRAITGAAAMAVMGLLSGAANAALYSSHFDPIGFVDFAGDGLFFVSDSCLRDPITDAPLTATFTAASCGAYLDHAVVDPLRAYDVPPPGPQTLVGTGHLDFGFSNDLIDVVIANGELVGVNSNLIGFVFPTTCTGEVCGQPWWIQWQSESAEILALARTSALLPVNAVNLYTGSCYSDYSDRSASFDGPSCSPDGAPIGTAFTVTFERVPEPGTLALLLGGVVAAWCTRRRTPARA